MTAEELYTEMKWALSCFQLRFGDKHEMLVTIDEDKNLVFSHNNRKIIIEMES